MRGEKPTTEELEELVRLIQIEIGREVNVAHFDPDEIARRRKENDHFITHVLQGQKMKILAENDHPELYSVGSHNEKDR